MLLVGFPDKGRQITGLLVGLVMGLLTLLFPGVAHAVQATLTDDTYTSNSASQTTTNFGTNSILRLQDPALASIEQRVYLKFDLSNLPGCPSSCPLRSEIDRASLRLYVNKLNSSGTFSVASVGPF